MPVHVLDKYYLGLTAVITVAYQLAFFAVAFARKFDKLTDFAGGSNFIVLAVVTLVLGSHGPADPARNTADGGLVVAVAAARPPARQVVATALLSAWALRLAGFLLVRILRTGKDDRFDGMRDRFVPFLGFWAAQMLWVWTASLPVTVINSPAVQSAALRGRGRGGLPGFGTPRDVAGLVLFGVGFLCEAVADTQRFRFRQRQRGQTGAQLAFCRAGLFAWSRHPNYFGDILLHFGIFTVASSDALPAVSATVVGPVLVAVLLFFVSGMTLSERPAAARRYAAAAAAAGEDGQAAEDARRVWAAYRDYLHRTSIVIPLPPALYAPLPVWVKRSLLLEFPLYVFDPAKHAAAPGKPTSTEENTVPDTV